MRGLLLPSYLAYHRPDFHPWQEGQMHSYREWKHIYANTDNALMTAFSRENEMVRA